jgi:hypothetical protein
MTKCMNQNVDKRILKGMTAFAAIVQFGGFVGARKALKYVAIKCKPVHRAA